MENQSSNPDHNERAALLYGMQRSGSNYIHQLMLQNFQNIRFYNLGISRSLPTHKHFRLYDEKSAIPDERYYNTFRYSSFKDFKRHVGKVAEQEIHTYIVCTKDPYSWYLSYKKHARKNKFTYFKRSLNTQFLIDYNLFYRKWLDFAMEAPEEVLLFRYEDLIEDLSGSLQRIAQKFDLERSPGPLKNPTLVPLSREFTKARASFYKEKKYLDFFSERDRSVIQHLLDPELMATLNYRIVR